MYRDIEEPPSESIAARDGRSVICVIGIDEYAAWPRLSNAVSDAEGAAQLFRRLGFVEVTRPLLDGAATREAMHHLVTGDLMQLSPDDSLVLFFAGHGHTHTTTAGGASVKTGYVIPVDGEQGGSDAGASWLRLDSWLSDVARLPPRHILVIIDACHSGCALDSLHKWRDDGPPAQDEVMRARRSRRVITSALDDQRAMDSGPFPGHSLFTGCLIEGLTGGLTKDGQRRTTGREIGQYLHTRVRSFPGSTQTPDVGAFELDDRGDMLIPLLGSTPEVVAPEPEPPSPSVSSRAPSAERFPPHGTWKTQRPSVHITSRRWKVLALGVVAIVGIGVAGAASWSWRDNARLAAVQGAGTVGEKGKGSEVAPDASKAAELYQQACNHDDMSGCTNLGLLYAHGTGVARDPLKAVELYRKSCDGGEMWGCNNLGRLYIIGAGVASDPGKAAELFQRACNGGNMRGCASLGYLYEQGTGVARNPLKAVELYRESCDGGDVWGCNSFGWAYEHGTGVDRDLAKAITYYQQACNGGNDTACVNLKNAQSAAGHGK